MAQACGTQATGYDEVTSIYGNTWAYLNTSLFGCGGLYNGVLTNQQIYKGNIRSMVMWRSKVSNTVVIKHYKWAQQRFGVA